MTTGLLDFPWIPGRFFLHKDVWQHTKEEILVMRKSPLTTHGPEDSAICPFMLSPGHTKSLCQSWPFLRTGDQNCCGESLSYKSIQRSSFYLDQSSVTPTAVLHPMSSHPRGVRDFVLLIVETFK